MLLISAYKHRLEKDFSVSKKDETNMNCIWESHSYILMAEIHGNHSFHGDN